MHHDLTPNDLCAYDIKRVLTKIRMGEPDECWEWTAARTPFGHGRITLTMRSKVQRSEYGHRLMYLIATGEAIPAGSVVRHSCDNPPCCNPAHLLIGTQRDNVVDREMRGRGRNGIKRCFIKDLDQYPEIPMLYASGLTCQEIANLYNVSAGTVWKWLKRNGVTLRGRGRVAKAA